MCLSKSVVQRLLQQALAGLVPWPLTSLGSLFQCPTTVLVKNLFLMSSLNLPCPSYKPILWILLLATREKRSAPASLLSLVRKL